MLTNIYHKGVHLTDVGPRIVRLDWVEDEVA